MRAVRVRERVGVIRISPLPPVVLHRMGEGQGVRALLRPRHRHSSAQRNRIGLGHAGRPRDPLAVDKRAVGRIEVFQDKTFLPSRQAAVPRGDGRQVDHDVAFGIAADKPIS